MANYITIKNITSSTLRIGTTDIVSLASVTVDADDQKTARDLDSFSGRYAVTDPTLAAIIGSNTVPLMDGTATAGVSTTLSRGDHVHPTDTSRAPLANPVFTGDPQAPTPLTADNDTSIATTAYVKAQGYVAAASPALTGTPTAPTAAVDTNTTQIATTAFVVGQAGANNPTMNGTVAVGTSLRYSREDHVHPSDTSRAPLASPSLTGTPLSTTAAVDTNTTQIATTAFVVGQAGAASPLMDGAVSVGTSLRYARQDHVHPTDTTLAPLASPTFTGDPKAPTPSIGDNDTSIATTAFVQAALPPHPFLLMGA